MGLHGDPGKPSVHPSQNEEGARVEAHEISGEMEAVGGPKEASREDQGGRWSRSTDGTSCNGRAGKGSWLTEEDRRRPANDARRERDARWEGTLPTLCSRRPKGGETGRSLGSVGTIGRGRTQGLPRPTRPRQRSAGNPPAPLGVADGGTQVLPPTLFLSRCPQRGVVLQWLEEQRESPGR